MTREQLLNILRVNGIKYDRDIELESTEGFVSDECAEYAEKLYGDLNEIVLYSVQNGFKDSADEIYKLTKLIASLINGISRKHINLTKAEAQRQDVLKNANKYLKRGINMEMLNQLNKNLDDCIAATDAIILIRKDNEKLCARLNESKAVLEEIKKVLAGCADLTSKEAAEYQRAIFEALMTWRESVSRYNCFTDTVDGLREALQAANKWQALAKTARNKAKMGEDYYEYTEQCANCDGIPRIVSAAKYSERTEGLRDHLSSYRKQTELLYGVDALRKEAADLQANYEKRRDEINARLAEIKKQSDAIMYEYQNGTMEADVADMKMSDLENEEANLQEELANLKDDYEYDKEGIDLRLSSAQSGARTRENVAKHFEKFVDKIESFKSTDPAMFVTLAKRLNFNAIFDTLTGRLSDQQVEEVYTEVETIISQVEADFKKQRESLVKFQRIDDTMRERQREEERVLRDQERARRDEDNRRREEERTRREEERKRREEERARNSAGGVRTAATGDSASSRMAARLAAKNGMPAPKPDGEGEGNPNPTGGLRNEDK